MGDSYMKRDYLVASHGSSPEYVAFEDKANFVHSEIRRLIYPYSIKVSSIPTLKPFASTTNEI